MLSKVECFIHKMFNLYLLWNNSQ